MSSLPEEDILADGKGQSLTFTVIKDSVAPQNGDCPQKQRMLWMGNWWGRRLEWEYCGTTQTSNHLEERRKSTIQNPSQYSASNSTTSWTPVRPVLWPASLNFHCSGIARQDNLKLKLIQMYVFKIYLIRKQRTRLWCLGMPICILGYICHGH